MLAWLTGHTHTLPDRVVERHPELAGVQWRLGGLLPRVAGWLLGQRSVAAITLWRTVWISPHARASLELLLHELRHVQQFQEDWAFPVRYIWETLRHGYHRNRFERDAREWAAAQLARLPNDGQGPHISQVAPSHSLATRAPMPRDSQSSASLEIRSAKESEIDRLAEIWFEAWNDAHADLLPAELKRLRTLESFRDRLANALPRVRVADLAGEPAGICIVREDELYQLFVAAPARGTGAAVALIDDAEARIRDGGAKLAWLTCAIGNERAARFYEKRGWRRTGVIPSRVETTEGEFVLDAWRYEKPL